MSSRSDENKLFLNTNQGYGVHVCYRQNKTLLGLFSGPWDYIPKDTDYNWYNGSDDIFKKFEDIIKELKFK